jgi:hypothetical protein
MQFIHNARVDIQIISFISTPSNAIRVSTLQLSEFYILQANWILER